MSDRSPRPPWAVPTAILALSTLAFFVWPIDQAVARALWTGDGWWLEGHALTDWIYRWAPKPGLVVACAALGWGILATRVPRFRQGRRAAWFLVAMLALGPGLFVNALSKPELDRPRPRDMVEFGGDFDYVPPFVRGPKDAGKALPSGHASMGFYFAAGYFLLLERSRRRARWALAASIALGATIGFFRMAEGAHFLSDVVWSFGFTYLSGVATYAMFARGRRRAAPLWAAEEDAVARVPDERRRSWRAAS